ncbi:ADP-ribosylglycohydrolase [Aspergillus sp. HF37]|nr:ADP-ribosylglycohydrolase [Aspergillus sp. HF37]
MTTAGLEFLSLHPFVRQGVVDRVRGAIVGGALGDAIGLYTEFLTGEASRAAYPEGQFRLTSPVTELVNDGHRNKFTKGSWTDDTDHALLIILSYLHHNGHQPAASDLALRLRFWCEQGLRCLDRMPMGLGQTVGRVVFDADFLADPTATAYRHWAKGNYKAAPNGSLMRTAPLGVLCIDKTAEETFATAAEFSAITHADPRCVVSCCLVSGLVRGILRGEVMDENDVDEFIEQSLEWAEAWVGRRRGESAGVEPDLDREEFCKNVRARGFEELRLDDMRVMGYVYKALGAGVLVLRLGMRCHPLRARYIPSAAQETRAGAGSANLFERLISTLILQGGDADTNACVAASLLGALLGYSNLPPHWRDGMTHSAWLLEKCDVLCDVVRIFGGDPGYKGSSDPDTRVDGGKGVLTKEELDARDKAFMDVYMARAQEKVRSESGKGKGWMGKVFGSI